MPGVYIGQMKYEIPWCLATSGFVRAMRMPNFAACPYDVQIYCPLTT
jgi:hypothetical protein